MVTSPSPSSFRTIGSPSSKNPATMQSIFISSRRLHTRLQGDWSSDVCSSDLSAEVDFLGGKASFPIGAYVMAALAGAPLIHVFSLREAGGHYHFFGSPAIKPEMPVYREREDRRSVGLGKRVNFGGGMCFKKKI